MQRAGDTSAAGRHIAVVSLHGAVEHALWLGCHHLHADVKPSGNLHQLQRGFADALMASKQVEWAPPAQDTIAQLRDVRNSAQHSGVVPPTDHMAQFADGAAAYIDSVLAHAFDATLADLALALAVRDLEVRERLLAAERAAATDAASAFDGAISMFDLVLDQWRLRLAARVPGQAAIAPRAEQDAVSAGDVVEVLPFASRIDEWVWLKHAAAERRVGWDPSPEDAERALRFVVGWITRFETFQTGYPEGQVVAWRDSIEPPSTDDGGRARVLGVTCELLSDQLGNPRWAVVAQLADIPGRGRAGWGVDLVGCVGKAASLAGMAGQFSAVRLALDGSFRVEFAAGVNGALAAGILTDAVHQADERHVERETATEARARIREQETARWLRLIGPHGDVFCGAAIRDDMRADGEHLVVRLEFAGDQPVRDGLVAADALRNLSGLWAGSGVGWVHDGLDVETWVGEEFDSDEERESGLIRAAAAVRRHRGIVEEQERAFETFSREVEAVLDPDANRRAPRD